MNKENKRLLNAVLITVVSCLVIFAAAISIFGKNGLWNTNSAPTNTVSTDKVIVPIEIGNTPNPTATGVVTNTPPENSGSVVCTREYAPVCGSDKQTYPNACVAKNQGITTITEGECPVVSTGTSVYPTTPLEVPGDKKLDQQVCTQEYAPICGVNNKTYSNTCMAGDIAVLHIGACDGTEKQSYESGSYQLYANSGLGYGFAMPKYSYYAGAGARDGSAHSMAIDVTASGILDFSSSAVQTWFYKKLPATPPSSEFKVVSNGIFYIKNNDTTGNAKIQKIVTTVLDSVE